MSKKPRVEFIQNAEPSFIREFKERAGIPAADTIESKRKQLEIDDKDDGDENRPEEEQPQIVYDPCSNVDELEARAFIKQWQYEHKLGYIPIEDENMKKANLDVPNRIIYRSAEERNASPTPGSMTTNGSGQLHMEGLTRDHGRNNDKKNTKKNPNSHDNSRSQKKHDRDRSPLDSKRKDTKCSLLSFDLEAEEEDEG